MNYDKIRNMNDNELKTFLQGYSKRDTHTCLYCGKETTKVIKIENKESLQTKALCGLCNECYEKFLEDLGTYDLGWDR